MIVVDSGALMEYLKDRKGAPAPPLAVRVREVIAAGLIATNPIIRYEVLIGEDEATKRGQKARELLDRTTSRTIDTPAVERALEAGRHLIAVGKPIGKPGHATPDILIAGIALAHGDSVLTSNRSDFEGFAALGLRLDPASA